MRLNKCFRLGVFSLQNRIDKDFISVWEIVLFHMINWKAKWRTKMNRWKAKKSEYQDFKKWKAMITTAISFNQTENKTDKRWEDSCRRCLQVFASYVPKRQLLMSGFCAIYIPIFIRSLSVPLKFFSVISTLKK